MKSSTPVVVSVVQAAPVFFNKTATLEKMEGLVREAAARGSMLILFPEVIIPGYPRGLIFGTAIGGRTPEGRELFLRYWENAIEVPGEETRRLGAVAKSTGTYLVVGVTERDTLSDTLYCTLLYFGPDGQLLHRHRKIKPTAAERIIWGEGDGSDLNVLDLPIGRTGGLVCWENYMPLARVALYEQGVQIYLAPTADCRDSWQATLTHIACEGRCFVLGCNMYLTEEHYPPELRRLIVASHPSLPSSGGSVIIHPLGRVLAGPLFGEEGILTAELDLRDIVKGKMDFDVVGHYTRPDLFTYKYNKQS